MQLNLALFSNVHTHTHTHILLDWDHCELGCTILNFISLRKVQPKKDATQFDFFGFKCTLTHILLDWDHFELSFTILNFISFRKLEPKKDATEFDFFVFAMYTHTHTPF